MKLDLENENDLDWALKHRDGVTERRFSAVLMRRIGSEGVLESLRNFTDLEKVRVADDYLRTKREVRDFEVSMESMFPELAFSWTYDLRIDGKHGR